MGRDTHALSVPAHTTALEVLAANGVEVVIAEGHEYTPTPVISWAILTHNRDRKTGLADGIVLTPSHNPPHGGPAEQAATAWIETKANELLVGGLRGVARIPAANARRAPTIRHYDFLHGYIADLGNVIDFEAILGAKLNLVDSLLQAKRDEASKSAWIEQKYPEAALGTVAYFSMEFMLSEALPIYSGGLGNVAGDQLKAASDLGVPVVGVGLALPARILSSGDRQGWRATGALSV